MPSSKTKMAICQVLQEEGYIAGFSSDNEAKPTLTVQLRFHNGTPVIEEISRVSRPGLRVYKACEDLPNIRGGLGVAIVSTNKGLLTDRAARAAGIGGEVLCTVF
jgi:small subunit ribosomal protein S8